MKTNTSSPSQDSKNWLQQLILTRDNKIINAVEKHCNTSDNISNVIYNLVVELCPKFCNYQEVTNELISNGTWTDGLNIITSKHIC